MKPAKPKSAADGLRLVALWLDAADALVEAEARRQGVPRKQGDEVQRDLNTLADWLDAHPDVNAEAWQQMPNLRRWAGS